MELLQLRVIQLWHPDAPTVTIESEPSATVATLLGRLRSVSSPQSKVRLYKDSTELVPSQSLHAQKIRSNDLLCCWHAGLEQKLQGATVTIGLQWCPSINEEVRAEHGMTIEATVPNCTSLPTIPERFMHLKFISFRSQAYDMHFFARIPDSITRFKSLRTLVAHKMRLDGKGNAADYLPRALPPTLTCLDIGSNSLTMVPHEWSHLRGLTMLDMASNSFTQVPNAILQLRTLKKLNLRGNRILTLPAEISGLRMLEDLNASENGLQQLPESLRAISSLRVLRASDNRIAQLPPVFSKPGCFQLDLLDLRSNAFTEFPQHFPNLVGRVLLNCSNGNATGCISSIRSPIFGLGRCSHLELTYHGINSQDAGSRAGLSSLADALPSHCVILWAGRLRENDLSVGSERIRLLSPQVLRAIVRQQPLIQQQPESNVNAPQSAVSMGPRAASSGSAGDGCTGSVAEVLATLSLSQWLDPLETLGVTEPTFLGELQEADLQSIGMPLLHRRRLLRSAASCRLPMAAEEPAAKRARMA